MTKGEEEEEGESTGIYDQIIKEVGEFGFYQKCRYFVLLIVVCYMATSQGGNVVMAGTFPVDFSCTLPSGKDLPGNLRNTSASQLKQWAFYDIPVDSSHKKNCYMRNLTEVGAIVSSNGTLIGQVNTTSIMACPNGYEYDPGHKESLTTQFDLVCDQDYWGDLFITVSTGVGVPGNYVFVILMDYFGRKIMFFIVVLYYIITSIGCIFSPNKYVFIVLTSFYMCSAGAVWMIGVIWLVELCGPKQRSWINGFFAGVSSLTAAIQIVQGYLLPTWQLLYVTTTAPAVPVLLLWWWMDESPRWLSTKGKQKQALKVLKGIAKTNGRPVSEERLKTMLQEAEVGTSDSKKDGEKQGKDKDEGKVDKISPISIFTNKNMLIHFVVTAYGTVACWVIYSGVNLSAGTISGDMDPYLIFGLITIVQFPAGLILVLSNTFGRVWTTATYTVIAGICSLVAAVASGSTVIVIIFVVIASFFINAAVTLSGQFVQELFPTSLRGSAVAYNSLLVGAAITPVPFILYAARFVAWAPMTVFAILGITAAVVFMFCPEMMGQNLMETIEETRTGPRFGWKSFWKNIRFEAFRNRNKSKVAPAEIEMK